ncbi:hypothetical protein A1Q1_03725 [Trichosporon asahii var. asahii CBS 2479]|uniref:HAT C-terminal dimerisation domain-containing protein n=1 Tax=Trichosporon asahii var. asahii (strain ATCC 90039 / CBS 2479 / JCM 2466 / KCTC 7840 / NBRC 103889/ NCYC 2677 / UAMH 7654) TaxID=1186058 RepID=J4U9V8_TRIAS|nr:hypothetical protein A1Q1_03725 [Trichosporon asahii var. asahii CBS 2479]EJT47470.1 hypothetical protein A1Q1_03725 [Trichosporon asahii var. asahii CBS 2479]
MSLPHPSGTELAHTATDEVPGMQIPAPPERPNDHLSSTGSTAPVRRNPRRSPSPRKSDLSGPANPLGLRGHRGWQYLDEQGVPLTAEAVQRLSETPIPTLKRKPSRSVSPSVAPSSPKRARSVSSAAPLSPVSATPTQHSQPSRVLVPSSSLASSIDFTQDDEDTVQQTPEPAKRRRRRDDSHLIFFQKIPVTTAGKDYLCRLCGLEYKAGERNLRSHLTGHRDRPPCSKLSAAKVLFPNVALPAPYLKNSAAANDSAQTTLPAAYQPSSDFKPEIFAKLLTLAVVESRRAILPSPQTIRRRITDLHSELEGAARTSFRASGSMCSLQTDVWTAAGGKLSFTGANLSWIDQDWVLHTDFAFFIPLVKRHTGVNLAEPLGAWLKEQERLHDVVSITTDGASNNVTMLEHLVNSHTTRFRKEKDHILCACHAIGRVVHAFMEALGCSVPPLRLDKAVKAPQLLVNGTPLPGDDTSFAFALIQDSLVENTCDESQTLSCEEFALEDCSDDDSGTDREETDSETSSDEECSGTAPSVSSSSHGRSAHMARRFCRVTNRSAHLSAEFEKKSGGRSLKQVSGIRWGNDIEVWESVLSLHSSISGMLLDHATHYGKHDIELDTNDFINLRVLIDVLGPLRDFTRQMEGNRPTGAFVLNMWLQLLAHLHEMRRKYAKSTEIEQAVDVARHKAEYHLRRAAQCRPIIIATALNPRCRLSYFNKNQQLGIDALDVKRLLIAACEEAEARDCSSDEIRPQALASEVLKVQEDAFYCDDVTEDEGSFPVIEGEIDRYNRRIGASPRSREVQHDPLEWWRLNQHAFPTLAKVARHHLSVLAAQAVTERLFSASGAVCEAKRMGRLHPRTISTQVGVDQLLRNGHKCKGDWGTAQSIVSKSKLKAQTARHIERPDRVANKDI